MHGSILPPRRRLADLHDDIEPFRDFPEDRVTVVQVRRWRERDEELAATRVGPVQRHPHRPAQVGTLVDLVANGVPGPAFAIAARAAVKDTATIANYVDEVLAARKMAYEGLAKLGIRAFDSQANFILFYAGDRSIPIRDALRDKGVLIRDRSYEIQGCVRVTIGTRAQIERFLKELEILWNR